jgi:nitroimidazol reductase NimA-like FMN-containing flavoprotein (pyridoxamine 5'-phosphate oxidase superfamily)
MAHLATSSVDGKPRVNPIWYAYENGIFYFTTRLSRLKGHHLKENPSIALSIATEQRPYIAVCAFGYARILEENRDEWLKKIFLRYQKTGLKSWLATVVTQQDRIVVMLKPDRILS